MMSRNYQIYHGGVESPNFIEHSSNVSSCRNNSPPQLGRTADSEVPGMGTSSTKVAMPRVGRTSTRNQSLAPRPSNRGRPGANPRSHYQTRQRRQASGLKHRPSEKPVASKPDNHCRK